jgi:hypothetical protein
MKNYIGDLINNQEIPLNYIPKIFREKETMEEIVNWKEDKRYEEPREKILFEARYIHKGKESTIEFEDYNYAEAHRWAVNRRYGFVEVAKKRTHREMIFGDWQDELV